MLTPLLCMMLTALQGSSSGDGAVTTPAATPGAQGRPVLPVLAFPEPGLDDTAAYQGYQTRFYRDSKDNTVQIYLQPKTSRAVLLWANAANESAGFTIRDAAGRPARVTWGAEAAEVADLEGALSRSIEYRLASETSHLELGWFVLGSMRIERDFVYAGRHLKPLGATPFQVAEESLLVAAVERLPAEERARHLALLNAPSIDTLRSRLQPVISVSQTERVSVARIERPSLDGKDRLVVELRVNPRTTKVAAGRRTVSLRTRPGATLRVGVRVSTTARPLRALFRDKIFNRAFLDFIRNASAAQGDSSAVRSRRLERQVRGVELLSSEEKLMAGLPNFATYFGRDGMMTALMMRPIWLPEMSEHVIASVLGKLGPGGEVSHEEALGGQAIREHAVVYDSLVSAYTRATRQGEAAGRLLEQAGEVLRDLQKTRENYHMVDDEFQLPVLVARYLADTSVSAERKRRFLLGRSGETSRLTLLLRELALVSSMAGPYVREPKAVNLVSFPVLQPGRWRSASWRDSDVGYGRGRFAMDINAIWVPAALRAIASILSSLPQLGIDLHALDSLPPALRDSPLKSYAERPDSLTRAIAVWSGARKHFSVTLSREKIRAGVKAKLASLPAAEQRYWQRILRKQGEPRDSLSFLVLALDSLGRPIPVINTDPATDLFLNPDLGRSQVLEDVAPFLRSYPVGLLVNGLGPLVANDAYASPQVWKWFEDDRYHSPRVVWGREVNLLLLGLAHQAERTRVPQMGDALRQTMAAVNASGLQHNELWSYEINGDRLLPIRYGTSSDVQLWNTTDLVVEYVLSGLSD